MHQASCILILSLWCGTKQGACYFNHGCMPQNSTAAQICVIVNRSDQEVSSHSPFRLQAEHFGVQNTARLQRQENTQCKAREHKVSAHN